MNGWMRQVLTVLLCVAVILPRASAVVAELAPVHINWIVICTGSDIATIVLDQDGNPVEGQALVAHPCTAAQATPLAARALPDWWIMARRSEVKWVCCSAPSPVRPARTRPAAPRAPPLLRDSRI